MKTSNMNNILDNIRIVLIQTSHPGNIGSAARAMKVMGLSDLCLVKPRFFPDDQANALASSATDILENATIVDTLQQAIADCRLVIGTSARHHRTLQWETQDSRSCGASVVKQAQTGKVAIVFGRESSGLTNEELSHCHSLVHIPTNPDYSSLNIASAVQILSYECRLAAQSAEASAVCKTEDERVSSAEMDGYFKQLETVLIETDFLDPDKPRHLMPRLRRLYSRTGVNRSELNILRGILTAFQKKN